MSNTRSNSALITAAKYGVALWAAGNLAVADGFGPGTIALPACLALCIAGLSASSGGMGAVAAWYACKTACIALAVVAEEVPNQNITGFNYTA